MLKLSINLTDIAILNIYDIYYRCIISGISKSETINLMQNIDLRKKRNIIKLESFCHI